ncbi:hypothetical protein A3SI_15146 [Nitritalea halalkaliphila LW7]|uniref:Uncharacterized protein n=1 Tax=Nitritalea halalkaliphila LW7 TaxID=1189621 RepID=I5BYX9_9BACT|nr:hypothetical protein [Nitritalea halalkaliphila]EIM74781.1 hypothetical protein A3SI_15146 [Nitritalea halalkaliphila LW7]
MRVIPIQINGEQFIPVDHLHFDQANDLRAWLPNEAFRSVRYEGLVIENCIAYASYVAWCKLNGVGMQSTPRGADSVAAYDLFF